MYGPGDASRARRTSVCSSEQPFDFFFLERCSENVVWEKCVEVYCGQWQCFVVCVAHVFGYVVDVCYSVCMWGRCMGLEDLLPVFFKSLGNLRWVCDSSVVYV